MNKFKVGYAKVNINPPLGIGVYGYYIPRFAKGFLDDLEAFALTLSLEGKSVVLLAVDNGGIDTDILEKYCEDIEKATGIKKENIFISASHTHTGPPLKVTALGGADEKTVNNYVRFLGERLVDAVKLSLTDMTEARMGYAVGTAPDKVAYIRRYKMKDGTTMTCPPIDDPDIDHPIGELDQRVNVLRFDRNGKDSIVLVNYGLHADTIGGELIASDWPGWMRKTIEKALDGTKCIFFTGAQGDVGSTNVHPSGGDMNDTEISFDNEMKSPGMARFVGRALAGTVLQVYDKVTYTDVKSLEIMHKMVVVPANVPKKEDLPTAHKYKELHEAGRDEDIPYTAMELTTVVAEALRMCALENGPESFNLDLTGVKIGDVALLGIPGEPFTDAGVQIKDTEGWSMIMPCALTNGNWGYFPMKSAYDEGGYEARTSWYKAGGAEVIIKKGKELLKELSIIK